MNKIIYITHTFNMEIYIKKIRQRKNISAIDISRNTGIDKSRLSRIEDLQPIYFPTIKELEDIAIYLHVKISELYSSEYK